jgi:hypothetical protein
MVAYSEKEGKLGEARQRLLVELQLHWQPETGAWRKRTPTGTSMATSMRIRVLVSMA